MRASWVGGWGGGHPAYLLGCGTASGARRGCGCVTHGAAAVAESELPLAME